MERKIRQINQPDTCAYECFAFEAYHVRYLRCQRFPEENRKKYNTDGTISVVDPGRVEIRSRSNFLHFHAVFSKSFCQIIAFCPQT